MSNESFLMNSCATTKAPNAVSSFSGKDEYGTTTLNTGLESASCITFEHQSVTISIRTIPNREPTTRKPSNRSILPGTISFIPKKKVDRAPFEGFHDCMSPEWSNISGRVVPQCRPVHRGRPAHTQRMVQLPEVHPRTVRPTERSPRAQNPDAKSRGTRDNAVRLRHVELARGPLRHAAPSPPQDHNSLHRLAKAQSRRPPDFLSGHAYKDGK